VTWILWRRLDMPGAERCVVDRTHDGYHLRGTTLVAADGTPHEIRWSVQTDERWNTLTVGAHVQGLETDRRMALHCDGSGVWTSGDEPVLGLYGATDVDLAWTPATNTLPIRRLDLALGDAADVAVAYIDFPGHTIERQVQRYERLGASTWRFSSGDFVADLQVDDDGLVLAYPGLWSTEAVRRHGVT
jgi:hypothetical protein